MDQTYRVMKNRKLKWKIFFALSLRVFTISIQADSIDHTSPKVSTTTYQNSFENIEIGKLPDDFLVFEGAFVVSQMGSNKVLELPSAPLGSFGLLFGSTEMDGIAVQARICGSSKGRRFPIFGVGLNGKGGYRLQLVPVKQTLELLQDEEVKSSIPYKWVSGSWTSFCLQIRKVQTNQWKVEGKAWSEEAKEPTDWMISLDLNQAPPPGRSSIWGMPYSETPIFFDDLVIKTAR